MEVIFPSALVAFLILRIGAAGGTLSGMLFVAAVAANYLIIRAVQNPTAGLLTSLPLSAHPAMADTLTLGSNPWLVSSSGLLMVLSTVLIWRQTFESRFQPKLWLVLSAALFASIAIATSIIQRQQIDFIADVNARWMSALRTTLFAAAAVQAVPLLIGSLLSLLSRHTERNERPSPGNIAMGFIMAVVPSAAMLGMIFGWDRDGAWPTVGVWHSARQNLEFGLGRAVVDDPWPWFILGFAALGIIRAIQRGGKQWSDQVPPRAWVLPLLAMLLVFAPQPMAFGSKNILALPTICVPCWLAVFAIVDLFQSAGERLVLKPPSER